MIELKDNPVNTISHLMVEGSIFVYQKLPNNGLPFSTFDSSYEYSFAIWLPNWDGRLIVFDNGSNKTP